MALFHRSWAVLASNIASSAPVQHRAFFAETRTASKRWREQSIPNTADLRTRHLSSLPRLPRTIRQRIIAKRNEEGTMASGLQLSRDELLAAYRRMRLIREFEERVHDE